MATPEETTVMTEYEVLDTSEVAGSYITQLDHAFSREDVAKIAEWIYFLSTQD